MTDHSPRSATKVDAEIGRRIRLARQLAQMSQGELSDVVGITFQQIQKYERGANRVAASRLLELATALNQPLAFFLASDGPEPTEGEALLAPLKHLSVTDAQKVLAALDNAPAKKRRNLIALIGDL